MPKIGFSLVCYALKNVQISVLRNWFLTFNYNVLVISFGLCGFKHLWCLASGLWNWLHGFDSCCARELLTFRAPAVRQSLTYQPLKAIRASAKIMQNRPVYHASTVFSFSLAVLTPQMWCREDILWLRTKCSVHSRCWMILRECIN